MRWPVTLPSLTLFIFLQPRLSKGCNSPDSDKTVPEFISGFFESAASSLRSVCFPSVGCFSGEVPFDDLPLPLDPQAIPPKFFIMELNRTKNGIIRRQVTDANQIRVDNLIVMAHGFTGSYDGCTEWNIPLALKLYEYSPGSQILFIDWKEGAAMFFKKIVDLYSQPASNTRTIGAAAASFLLQNPKFNMSRSYCIGFSLGAHVCGFMAKYMRQKWARISAIDPAAPLFNKKDNVARVDKSDAYFMDVLHTSYLGLNFDVGHVDFYVNTLRIQPGCEKELMPAGTPMRIVGEMTAYFSCSHSRAPELFIETINPVHPGCHTAFKVCPCPDGLHNSTHVDTCSDDAYQMLGFRSFRYPNRVGAFCGKTTADPPFC